MLKSSLCDYSDAYVLVKGSMAIEGNADANRQADKRNNGVIFKKCVPMTDCVSKVNNTQGDIAKDLDVVMPVSDTDNFKWKNGWYHENS